MRRLVLASAALLALMAGAASAADVPPSRSAPPPLRAPAYVPFFSWNGLYVGVVGGYGWGTSKWTNAAATTGDFSINGAFVGGTVGYNIQTGAVVFGLEGDVVWNTMKGSTTTNCAAGCETSSSWLATVRGRIGYAFDRFLPYLTGGMATGEVKASTPGLAGMKKTPIGWTAGGGIEYAFVNNWSAKAEYLYFDLGKSDCGMGCSAVAPTDVTLKSHLMRFGLNYKF
jgi:outer membrane immunogenic protein